jgi:hypothetical protein
VTPSFTSAPSSAATSSKSLSSTVRRGAPISPTPSNGGSSPVNWNSPRSSPIVRMTGQVVASTRCGWVRTSPDAKSAAADGAAAIAAARTPPGQIAIVRPGTTCPNAAILASLVSDYISFIEPLPLQLWRAVSALASP